MWPFGSGDDSKELPPKPESYSDGKEETHAVYETTFEYRNGDTETVEHYGIRAKKGNEIVFNVYAYPSISWYGENVYSGFKTDSRSFEVLSREPVTQEVGEHTFLLTWDVTYSLENETYKSLATEWEERVTNAKLEVIEE